MSDIDLRSINLMTGLMCVVLGAVILGMKHNFPASIKGLGLWGLGPLTGMLAAVFYGTDGLLPPDVATIGGNALGLISSGLMYFGSLRFYEQKIHWRRWAGLAAVSLGAISFFVLAEPDFRIRIAIFAGSLMILCAAHTRLLAQQGRGFAARFTATVMGLQTLTFAIRLAAVYWIDSANATRFSPVPIHSAYFVGFSFMLLLFLLGVLLMASERVRAEFEHLATYDSLTGTLNRRVIQLAGEQELLRWQRYGHAFSVMLLDIDYFKKINDQHGHQMGDAVLQQMVTAVRKSLRKTDLLGRYGGEEFLVLLTATDPETALKLGERIRSAVETTLLGPDNQARTISIGATCVRAGDTRFDDLVSRADQAMYQAKALGRNKVVMFDDTAVTP